MANDTATQNSSAQCSFCNVKQTTKDAVFCSNCGTRLTPETKQAVATDRLKFWGGELRLLSAFFVNFIGFERFAEKRGYHHAMILLRECLKEIENMIKSIDGTSNQIVPDDRVLGIFGAPRAHHDDAVRAVRCAMHIKNWWLEKKAAQKLLENLDITIGINTGRAFFGYVLEETSYLTVIGDTINTASRLAEICPPHEILISDTTYEKVREYVDIEHLGERSVKGRRAKIDVYLVKQIREEPEVKPTVKITLFGREEELKRLIATTEKIKNNELAFGVIRGQMGIGKTRLKEEFENYLTQEKLVNYMETHCSTEVESPYYAFKFLLRRYFEINEFDAKDAIAHKIDNVIAKNDLSLFDARGIRHLFLTDLRRLRGDEIRVINEEIFASIKNIIRHECRVKPLVLIFEEFNKADKMSRDLIAYLVAELEKEPLMFLMVNISTEFMDSIVHTVRHIEELNLAPLSINDVGNLVKHMLVNVDEKIPDFIFRMTGGNPLFAVEAVRYARRANVIKEVGGRWSLEKEQRLPFIDDLYGVIMSTIDSLPSEYRLIVDYASVIGYSFSLRILEKLFERPDIKDKLTYLVNEGYIFLSKDQTDPVYVFRHNLLRDAAYTVLPMRKKKEIHKQVAILFETLYADQLSDFYENIGHHYFSCDSFGKATYYYKLAGDRAKNLYAVDQAFSLYNTVLKISKDKSDQVPLTLVREVLLNLTDLYEMTGNIQRMEKAATEGLESAVKEKDTKGELTFAERNIFAQILLGQLDKAELGLIDAIHKCDGKIPELQTVLYSDLGLLYANRYEYEKSVLNYSLSWNTARNNHITEGEILCLLNLAQLHKNLGNYEQSLEYLQFCLESLIQANDLRRVVQFKFLIAGIYLEIWHLEKAKDLLLESSAISDSIGGLETYIKSALDLALVNMNNNALDEAEKYLRLVDKKISFFTKESLLAEINLKKALFYYRGKDFSKARNFNQSALKIAQEYGQRDIECSCYNLVSLIDEAAELEFARKALSVAETTKLPPLISAALFRLTQIHRNKKDWDRARHYGRKALMIYDDIKNKLSEENRKFYGRRPEYLELLGI